MEILIILSFIGMVIFTIINLYILKETITIRKETILIREISEKVEHKL